MVPFASKPEYTKGERKYLPADNDSSNPVIPTLENGRAHLPFVNIVILPLVIR